jgi:tRNA pseudouridine32 synthase / 23S rRNA pseudouridine746 synthase
MHSDPHFIPFEEKELIDDLPSTLHEAFDSPPHPLCIKAAEQVQDILRANESYRAFFKRRSEIEERGKMFGVLVVRSSQGTLGYLAAGSGKWDGSSSHPGFVPPIFDGDHEDGFLTKGMNHLKVLSERITELQSLDLAHSELESLKVQRARYSKDLQHQLFSSYSLMDRNGKEKNLLEIFELKGLNTPPAAAGECAAPKLLDYAFRHGMSPLFLSEFWWGASRVTDTEHLIHGNFYPPCEDRCRPILEFMLGRAI